MQVLLYTYLVGFQQAGFQQVGLAFVPSSGYFNINSYYEAFYYRNKTANRLNHYECDKLHECRIIIIILQLNDVTIIRLLQG